ncbi:MAG: glycosyltransferase family 2 protein [Vicinamibacterales bacterium]
MGDVTIIIVSFNTRAELEACLASMASAPPSAPHRIIVVDNASSDGSPDAVRRNWPEVRLVASERNLGFAAANNLAIREAATEFVLLLNSDTLVPAGSIDALVRALESDAGAIAAGPRLVGADGRPELSFGAMMGPFSELRQKIVGRLYDRRVGPVVAWVGRQVRRRQYADWVSGACLLVRRADALAAGLLDERYFLYAEDVDFCAALRALGRRILFTPAAEVVHVGGASGRARPAETARAYRRSQVAFYEKHHPRWVPLLRGYLRLRGALPEGRETGGGPVVS